MLALPPGYDDSEYTINANGAIVSRRTGRIVANPGGGKNAISPARSSELRALRKARQERDRMVGLARSMGLNPSDIDDELLEQAGSAIAALTEHMARTFLQSSNLRGMGETYNRLLGLDDDKDRGTQADGTDQTRALTSLLAQVRGLIGDRDRGAAVDATVVSVDGGNTNGDADDSRGGVGEGSG